MATPLGRTFHALRRRPAILVRLILVTISIASFLAIARDLAGQNEWSVGIANLATAANIHVQLVLQALILSWLWRTVSLRTVVTGFLIGFGPIAYLTIVVNRFVNDVMGRLGVNDFFSHTWVAAAAVGESFWAGPVEEMMKVLPLILLVVWSRSGLRRQSGPLDFAVLAASVGAGFGFAEDTFQLGSPYWRWQWTGWDDISGTLGPYVTNPTLNAALYAFYRLDLHFLRFSLGPVTLFPEMIDGGPIVFLGHGTYPLAFGLALGLVLHSPRTRRSAAVWIVPTLVLLWGIVDHVASNMWGSFPQPSLLTLVATLSLHGRLLPLALVVGWVVASVASHRTVVRHADPETRLFWQQVRYDGYRAMGVNGAAAFISDVLEYLRLRRRLAFGLFRYSDCPAEDAPKLVPGLLATRTAAYLLAERLRAQPRRDIPLPVVRKLARAMPVT